MKPIQRNEVLPIGDYEGIRPHFRARVIAEKKVRRFSLGPSMSGVFENRDTVLLQIQEMLRTERITREDGVLHEIETYNELVPGPSEVSMTCFVEIPDRALREATLERLAGLEKSFFVEVDGQAYPATNSRDEDAQPNRTTAVHYLKARLPPDAVSAVVGRRARVAILVRHPGYEARADLDAAARDALAADLADA
jgi:Protein of unknown function (DUF3501)